MTAISKSILKKHAEALLNFCDNPAAEYKVRYSILDTPYGDPELVALRVKFLESDIVEEMYREQAVDGGWGDLFAKDYSVKAKIPTSAVGIVRCLYIGLAKDDRDILFMAKEYLEGILDRSIKTVLEKNERAIPWRTAGVCDLLEAIQPNNELCDDTFNKWLYVASAAYADDEYSYERDKNAQHDVFWTHEKRLIPMQCGLLLRRRNELTPKLENAMLRHLGSIANEHGNFWDKTPTLLPEQFYSNKTRRWFHTFNYINQFRGSALYLKNAVEWLMSCANEDGTWDYGPQINDPYGYFGNFSLSRRYAKNRVVDCTIEVLSFLKQYIENNDIE